MTGEWLPIRLELDEDPAVVAMAAKLKLPEEHVVGCCVKLWSWANRQLADGRASGVTLAWIDQKVRVPGFASAMLEVGWLQMEATGFVFPGWETWNGKGAKRRLMESRRKAADRARQAAALPASNADIVRTESGHAADENGTRGQESRGEERQVSSVQGLPRARVPSSSTPPPGTCTSCGVIGALAWRLLTAKPVERCDRHGTPVSGTHGLLCSACGAASGTERPWRRPCASCGLDAAAAGGAPAVADQQPASGSQPAQQRRNAGSGGGRHPGQRPAAEA